MDHLQSIFDDISTAPTREALWQVMLDYVHSKGVVMASYHAVNHNDETLTIASDGFPEDWVCHYIEDDLLQIDPIPELAATLARPFYWHDIRKLAPMSERGEAFVRELEDWKIGDGLALYVFGPAMQNAYVGLGFGAAHIELTVQEVFEIQCVTQAGHLRFCALGEDRAHAPKLSNREREVLEWVAQGKSNSVIADIMGVSSHTVDAHMRGIYRKLNVNDRTSAAVRGLGSGVLQYPRRVKRANRMGQSPT
ncbi:autoinducer binding domain-containing protein [Roseobacteraceae bacterium S113]